MIKVGVGALSEPGEWVRCGVYMCPFRARWVRAGTLLDARSEQGWDGLAFVW